MFGFEFPDGVDERYPVHSTYLPYPDSKIAAEQVVLQAHLEGRGPATIVRPGDVYGPGSRAWAVIPAELIRARRFTLSDGIGVPYREFFAPYAELVGRRLITLPTPVAIAGAAVTRQLVRLLPGDNEINPAAARYLLRRGTYSIEKARRVLGWEPRVGTEEGLSRTMAWLREQGFGAPS